MGHTSLESKEGSQMDRLLGVVFGESLDTSSNSSSTALGSESHAAVTWRRKFTMRLKIKTIAFYLHETAQFLQKQIREALLGGDQTVFWLAIDESEPTQFLKSSRLTIVVIQNES